jgi:Holliday junction DNA helicase RuvA
MIASLSGVVNQIGSNYVVIGVGGMGIRVFVPRPVIEQLGGIGRSSNLFTHLIVRETELTLYGFDSEEDLHLFEILLAVNGVGP